MTLPDVADIRRRWAAVAAADAAFDRGDDAAAVQLYASLADGGSRFAYATYRAGLALSRMGQRAQAAAELRRAADLGHPLAMVELARLAARDRSDEARSWLRRAVDFGLRDVERLRVYPELGDLLVVDDDELMKRAQPARLDENRRQLDFWLGEWDVRAADGRPAGRNTIRSLLGGALIHEDWQSVAGWRGQSINFYNADGRSWEQVWVQDDGSHTHYTGGRFSDGALRFETSSQDGQRRLSFHPLPNGWVRQVGEAEAADRAWTVEYDLIYTPRADGSNGTA